jgi:hypothetical protein
MGWIGWRVARRGPYGALGRLGALRDWLCIVVRCDHPGSPLSLHLSVPELDIEGDIELVIDENTFALSVARLVESLPLSTPPGATSRILPGPIIAADFARPPSALVNGLRLAESELRW